MNKHFVIDELKHTAHVKYVSGLPETQPYVHQITKT